MANLNLPLPSATSAELQLFLQTKQDNDYLYWCANHSLLSHERAIAQALLVLSNTSDNLDDILALFDRWTEFDPIWVQRRLLCDEIERLLCYFSDDWQQVRDSHRELVTSATSLSELRDIVTDMTYNLQHPAGVREVPPPSVTAAAEKSPRYVYEHDYSVLDYCFVTVVERYFAEVDAVRRIDFSGYALDKLIAIVKKGKGDLRLKAAVLLSQMQFSWMHEVSEEGLTQLFLAVSLNPDRYFPIIQAYKREAPLNSDLQRFGLSSLSMFEQTSEIYAAITGTSCAAMTPEQREAVFAWVEKHPEQAHTILFGSHRSDFFSFDEYRERTASLALRFIEDASVSVQTRTKIYIALLTHFGVRTWPGDWTSVLRRMKAVSSTFSQLPYPVKELEQRLYRKL